MLYKEKKYFISQVFYMFLAGVIILSCSGSTSSDMKLEGKKPKKHNYTSILVTHNTPKNSNINNKNSNHTLQQNEKSSLYFDDNDILLPTTEKLKKIYNSSNNKNLVLFCNNDCHKTNHKTDKTDSLDIRSGGTYHAKIEDIIKFIPENSRYEYIYEECGPKYLFTDIFYENMLRILRPGGRLEVHRPHYLLHTKDKNCIYSNISKNESNKTMTAIGPFYWKDIDNKYIISDVKAFAEWESEPEEYIEEPESCIYECENLYSQCCCCYPLYYLFYCKLKIQSIDCKYQNQIKKYNTTMNDIERKNKIKIRKYFSNIGFEKVEFSEFKQKNYYRSKSIILYKSKKLR